MDLPREETSEATESAPALECEASGACGPKEEQQTSDPHSRLPKRRLAESLRCKLLQIHPDDERIRAAAPRLSECLAEVLCSTTTSLKGEDPEPETVNLKLQSLVEALKLRRQKRAGIVSSQDEFLRRLLGPQKYIKVRRLVEEIKLERFRKVGENCAQCRRQANGTLLCRSNATTTTHSKAFSPAVKRLFFRVELMHALEFRSLQMWKETDWDSLIVEAEEILNDYRTWCELGGQP